MDLGRAVTFIFEDRKWIFKIMILTLFSVLSLSSIFIVGLAALTVALGYMVQIATNVCHGLPRPLPKWGDMSTKFILGGQVLAALIVYNLPLVMIGACSSAIVSGLGGGLVGQAIGMVTLCVTLPFLIIYMLIAWPMYATALARFIETGQAHEMYRFTHLWDVMRTHKNAVMRWVLYAVIVNFIVLVLLPVVVVGWMVILIFFFPVHGHLLGQYAHQLTIPQGAKSKRKFA